MIWRLSYIQEQGGGAGKEERDLGGLDGCDPEENEDGDDPKKGRYNFETVEELWLTKSCKRIKYIFKH